MRSDEYLETAFLTYDQNSALGVSRGHRINRLIAAAGSRLSDDFERLAWIQYA